MTKRKIKKAIRQTAYLTKQKPRYIKSKRMEELGLYDVKGTERAKPPVKNIIKAIKELQTKTKNKKFQLNLNLLPSPHCLAKRSTARHDYFSMIKSGKGAGTGRATQFRDRFNSKC